MMVFLMVSRTVGQWVSTMADVLVGAKAAVMAEWTVVMMVGPKAMLRGVTMVVLTVALTAELLAAAVAAMMVVLTVALTAESLAAAVAAT